MNICSKLPRLIAVTLIGALAVRVAAAAPAAYGTDLPHSVVKYGDLIVSSPQGAAVLYRRIAAAAGAVCHPLDDKRLGSRSLVRDCIDKAIADAVAKVSQPALNDVYNAKNGRPAKVMVAAN
ncbi:MAG: hypothetical protein NVSMB10_10060 [Steroidobacteraceae bacterium]